MSNTDINNIKKFIYSKRLQGWKDNNTINSWAHEYNIDIVENILVDALNNGQDLQELKEWEFSWIEGFSRSEFEDIETLKTICKIGWYDAYNIVFDGSYTRFENIDELLEYFYCERDNHGDKIPVKECCKFWYDFIQGFLGNYDVQECVNVELLLKLARTQICRDFDLFYCEDNGYFYEVDNKEYYM